MTKNPDRPDEAQPADADVVIWELQPEGRAYMVKGAGSPPTHSDGRNAWQCAYDEAQRRAGPKGLIWRRHLDGTFHRL